MRAALENKRAYATRHHYSLYVLDDRRRGDGDDAARPECVRRSAGWFKLLALEEQVRLAAVYWLGLGLGLGLGLALTLTLTTGRAGKAGCRVLRTSSCCGP